MNTHKKGWYFLPEGSKVPVGPFATKGIASDEAARGIIRQAHDSCLVAFDKGTQRSYDKDGHLHVKMTNISKAAINPYRGREIPDWNTLGLEPEKIYRLLRHPDELAKAASTFNGKKLLSVHKETSANEHQKDLVVGATGSDAVFEHPYLKVSLVVWPQDDIDDIEDDVKKELSSAYRYRADMTPGTYEGQPYDGVMRDIVGNHVAIVKEGRAGPDVVVGDSNQEIGRMKIVLTRKAAMLQGAVFAHLSPMMAQDAKVDLTPVFAKVTAENFGKQKARIVKDITARLKGKLAVDADLDDLTDLLDKLDGESPEEGVDTDPSSGLPMANLPGAEGEEDDTDAEEANDAGALHAKIKSLLEGKISPEVMAAVSKLMGEEDAGGGQDKDPENPDDKEKEADMKKGMDADEPGKKPEMVSKAAMDAALTKTRKETRAEIQRTMREVRDAEKDVRPVVGELEMACDSAEDVYRGALDAMEVEVEGSDKLPLAALKSVFKAHAAARTSTTATKKRPAMDAKGAASYAERFPEAGHISNI